MSRITSGLAVTLVAALTAGCATQAYQPVAAPTAPAYGPSGSNEQRGAYGRQGSYSQQRVEYGQVHSIDLIRAQNQTTGGGGLVGGVLGAVVGRQIGSGSGRTAGTLIGAVGGAIIGNEIEKNQRGARDFYRVAIRTQQGDIRSFDYAQLAELHVGDRVRIENNQVYRY
jgi:outer membrane lipoprotein SlyB